MAQSGEAHSRSRSRFIFSAVLNGLNSVFMPVAVKNELSTGWFFQRSAVAGGPAIEQYFMQWLSLG